MNLSADDDSRGKYPGRSSTFSGTYSPPLSTFPAGPLSTIRVSSSKLKGLNDRKYSKLQMLRGAVAKNESSVRVLLAGIGRFPPLRPFVCVCVFVWAHARVHVCGHLLLHRTPPPPSFLYDKSQHRKESIVQSNPHKPSKIHLPLI